MMPVVERNLQVPGPIRLLLHGMDLGTPIIEIANHGNRLRLRRRAEEVGRLGHVSGRVTAVVGAVRRSRTHCVQRLHLVIILNPWGRAFTGLTAIENQNCARSASGKPRKMKIFLQQFVDKDVAQSRLGPSASTLVRRRHLLYVQRNARFLPTVDSEINGVLARLFELQLLDRKSTRLNSSHSQISYAV